MHSERLHAGAVMTASVIRLTGVGEALHASGRYVITCRDSQGNLKWKDHIDNLVTDVGAALILDTFFSGAGYTAGWYIGLISGASYTTGPVVGDTSASHGGWTESVAYSQANRPTASFASANGVTREKTLTSVLAFSINGDATIKGCFLISSNVKGGATGTLYSAGLFSNGDKKVGAGDTLNVGYTALV